MDTITAVAQPMQAVAAADTRRSAVAELKRRVRARQLSVKTLVLDAPEDLERHLTWGVPPWTPPLGRAQPRALNARAPRRGHVNLAAPLGALTARQRRWLADELQGR